jgi:hypothetical protein
MKSGETIMFKFIYFFIVCFIASTLLAAESQSQEAIETNLNRLPYAIDFSIPGLLTLLVKPFLKKSHKKFLGDTNVHIPLNSTYVLRLGHRFFIDGYESSSSDFDTSDHVLNVGLIRFVNSSFYLGGLLGSGLWTEKRRVYTLTETEPRAGSPLIDDVSHLRFQIEPFVGLTSDRTKRFYTSLESGLNIYHLSELSQETTYPDEMKRDGPKGLQYEPSLRVQLGVTW